MIDWSHIVSEQGDTVWRTVYRILRNDADAWDCYQETFLSAYRTAVRKPPQDWRSFLICVATRRSLDRLRQRIRSRRQTLSLESAGELTGRTSSSEESAVSNEWLEQARCWLAELPENQAAAFWMRGVEELNYQEIAQALDVDVNHVGVLLHRARTRLQELLADGDAEQRKPS